MLYAIFSVLLSFLDLFMFEAGVGCGATGVGGCFSTYVWNLFLMGVTAGSYFLLSIPIEFIDYLPGPVDYL